MSEVNTTTILDARRSALGRKPPNVLIYSGQEDSPEVFNDVRAVLQQCLNTDRYTVYHLKKSQIDTTPWMDNTVLLVIPGKEVTGEVGEQFMKYFRDGGTMVCFGGTMDGLLVGQPSIVNSMPGLMQLKYDQWKDVVTIGDQHAYVNLPVPVQSDVTLNVVGENQETGQAVIVEAVHTTSGGVAILAQVRLYKDPDETCTETFIVLKQSNASRFEILTSLLIRLGLDCSRPGNFSLTPLFLVTEAEDLRRKFLDSISKLLSTDGCLETRDANQVKLQFFDRFDRLPKSDITQDLIPIVTEFQAVDDHASFKRDEYMKNLTTKVLGNVVMFGDVVGTTMNFFPGLMFSTPVEVGLVAIARRQTCGQGRGGNAWLSPDGCAMLSLHVRIPSASYLGGYCTNIQHIMALAVVLAVRSKPGYEWVDVRVKWPNDIYYGSKIKLGGILVRSSTMRQDGIDIIHANVGCGVNVSNNNPTTCINDIASMMNKTLEKKLDLWSSEELIARIITVTEQLLDEFKDKQEHERFLQKYYQYWLHSNAKVRLHSESSPEVQIVGLDKYGYLQVLLPDGTNKSVESDGNTFDMMRNLIVART